VVTVAGPAGRAYAYQVLVLDELGSLRRQGALQRRSDLAADDPQAVLLTKCRA